ncbi:hypothetical protein STEG23_009927 [Scotinomys teguina]
MPSHHKVGAPYPNQRAWPLGPWIDKPHPARRKSPCAASDPAPGTPEKSPCPHHYISPLESCPSYTLGPRSTQTPSHHKDPGAPGHHHTTRTQEHPDAITPQGPRSTQTPLQHKPHAGTQEHRTPLD